MYSIHSLQIIKVVKGMILNACFISSVAYIIARKHQSATSFSLAYVNRMVPIKKKKKKFPKFKA